MMKWTTGEGVTQLVHADVSVTDLQGACRDFLFYERGGEAGDDLLVGCTFDHKQALDVDFSVKELIDVLEIEDDEYRAMGEPPAGKTSVGELLEYLDVDLEKVMVGDDTSFGELCSIFGV
jgi:hypothetical protein